MFEYEQDVVEELLKDDARFQGLFKEHTQLKAQVHEAAIGVHPLDDLSLGRLKRQKLLTKDKMAHMIQRYQSAHV
jgi:uncharacterized protein YdcH (DUF465 family)